MTPALTYVRLLVADLPACFRFYRDTLGLAPAFGGEDDVYAEFSAGPVMLALFKQPLMSEVVGTTGLPASAASQDRVVLCLAVPDVDAAAAALQARGVALVTPPTDRPGWGLRTAHFRDPDDNLIEISHDIPMEG